MLVLGLKASIPKPKTSVGSCGPRTVRNFGSSKNAHAENSSKKYTSKLTFRLPKEVIPTYRVMDENGTVEDESQIPQELNNKETLVHLQKLMLQIGVMDTVLYDVQRQGRVSFYMTNNGEEATQIGSAAALKPQDNIFAQYREVGVFIYRGFTLGDIMNQCYSNRLDPGKGRQMPVHYGSKKLNIQTISSPLATQLPQAAGAAYAQKLLRKPDECTVCYFGEGAASEGDFHAALNIAATLDTPTLFFCRNNGWAISTPSREQFRGDGISSRGAGYGIPIIRVDGNDLFGVYNATSAARKHVIEKNQPVLLETMSYRVGHHSTSDDSTRYRSAAEVDAWRGKSYPTKRIASYLADKGWWTAEEEQAWQKEVRDNVLSELRKAEAEKKPHLVELFNDVYDQLPAHLLRQQKELEAHLAKYPDNYPVEEHEK